MATAQAGLTTLAPGSKFQRVFWMQVMGQTITWTITSPLTLELDINRGAYQATAEGEFTIYNLGANARSDIYLDWNDQFAQSGGYRKITVRAGYASWQNQTGPQNPQSLPVIFDGYLYNAYSTRSGPSWITTMRAWDGGFSKANSYINTTFSSGVNFNSRVKQVAAAMTNVTSVYISPLITAPVTRGRAYCGSPWDILVQLATAANADVFIDLGKLYMVPKGQAVPGLGAGITTITSDYGLINTPIKQKFYVSFDMLFEPRLQIGQNINLQSLESVNDGSYTLVGLKHSGIISDAVGGECKTTPTCWYSSSTAAVA